MPCRRSRAEAGVAAARPSPPQRAAANTSTRKNSADPGCASRRRNDRSRCRCARCLPARGFRAASASFSAVERGMDRIAARVEPEIIARDLPARAQLVEQTFGIEAAADQMAQCFLDRIVLRVESREREIGRKRGGKTAHAAGDIERRWHPRRRSYSSASSRASSRCASRGSIPAASSPRRRAPAATAAISEAWPF